MTEPNPDRRAHPGYAVGLASFATFLYLALVVCAFGVISLLADIDVMPDRSVGPIVGPVMVAFSVVGAFATMVVAGLRSEVGRMLPGALVAGAVCYLLFVLSGSVLAAASSGQLLTVPVFAAEQATRPFALAVGVLAALVYVLFLLVLSRRDAGGTTPHWGWEGDERE